MYDEGIIITNHPELQYYLSLLDKQLPIESPCASELAGNLNAKLSWVLSEIMTRPFNAGIHLSIHVNALFAKFVGVGVDYEDDDVGLIQKRVDIVHFAAALLEKWQLLKIEQHVG
ncbi:hypothetical protein EDD85DRAFT_556556 [Armillaria nabsnona]|nr:hypothetical protein EDD85DRAFT_556556 [Armillaria nabsnona]